MYFLLLILISGQRILDPEVYPGCLQVHDYSISAYQGLPYMGLSENRVAHNPMVHECFPIKNRHRHLGYHCTTIDKAMAGTCQVAAVVLFGSRQGRPFVDNPWRIIPGIVVAGGALSHVKRRSSKTSMPKKRTMWYKRRYFASGAKQHRCIKQLMFWDDPPGDQN